MSNIIDLKPIKEFVESKYEFYIPSYQRGYRWDTQQVKELLDDLWEFKNNKSKDEFYCLQPVVVKKKYFKDGNMKWELIDGQQRLTTIYIILYYINNNIFKEGDSTYTLEYQTRSESENFLKDINEKQKDDNIDFYHIYNAFKCIDKWFKLDKMAVKKAMEIYPILLNDTKVIWYEINESTDSIDIFTRINLGKIPLTNAELIKALLLKKDNFSYKDSDNEKIRLKQLEISGEWDRIEYSLQNDEFWHFLCNDNKEYPTRIEFIFDIMSEEINNRWQEDEKIQKQGNDYFSFLVFSELEKSERSINENKEVISKIWHGIKNNYMIFEEWFSNRELYHLVGYLVSAGTPIKDIKRESQRKNKKEFIRYLHGKINKTLNLNEELENLDYGKNIDRKKIKNILLLFNIVSLQNNENSNIRFPFDRYKLERWDIEHIHAVQSQIPKDNRSIINLLNLLIEKSDNVKIIERARYILGEDNDLKEGGFEEFYEDIIKQYGDSNEINNISNLTLLDSTTNRSYKNAIFPIKRKRILENDKKGTFIPICTKNVFLKYYSENIDQMTYWSKNDRRNYLDEITNTLKKYL